MPTIKAILFDLDGTLTDSALDLSISVNHMLRTLGMPEQPVETIYGYIGRGVANMLKSALGEEHKEKAEEALRVFRDHYWEHCLDSTRLYPGAMETIEALKNYKLAVVTNKTRRFADKILNGLGVLSKFDLLLGGDDYTALKPDPAPVLQACQMLGVRPAQALMVGDSTPDIRSAVDAGAHACGVTYGLGKREELVRCGAKWLLDSMALLPDLVYKITNEAQGDGKS